MEYRRGALRKSTADGVARNYALYPADRVLVGGNEQQTFAGEMFEEDVMELLQLAG